MSSETKEEELQAKLDEARDHVRDLKWDVARWVEKVKLEQARADKAEAERDGERRLRVQAAWAHDDAEARLATTKEALAAETDEREQQWAMRTEAEEALAEARGEVVKWLRSLSDGCGHQPSELADQIEKDWPTEPFRSTSVVCEASGPEGETE